MSQSNKTQILKKLGANIRQLRLKKNLSQEELAFQINSARNFIGCIERAETNSSVITLCRISNALGVSLSELVKEIDTL